MTLADAFEITMPLGVRELAERRRADVIRANGFGFADALRDLELVEIELRKFSRCQLEVSEIAAQVECARAAIDKIEEAAAWCVK